MKESEFYRKIREICGEDTMAQHKYLEKFNKVKILDTYEKGTDENNRWKLFNPLRVPEKLESGVYLTIRCGYSGIYQQINIWDQKKKDWEIKIADGSYTIMYKDIEL